MSVVCGFCPSMSNLLFSFLHDMLDGTKRASERTNEIGTPRGRHRRLRLSKPKPPAKWEVVWCRVPSASGSRVHGAVHVPFFGRSRVWAPASG